MSDSRPTSITRTAVQFQLSPGNRPLQSRSPMGRSRQPVSITFSSSTTPSTRMRLGGVLAGVQDARGAVASAVANIHPYITGYVAGYYQWPDNWKFTGRVGVQYFGGAQILNVTPIQSFTQPVLRLDIDRMDDDDNRLFGVTAEIAWVPKPSYLLTLRTPLYVAVRK